MSDLNSLDKVRAEELASRLRGVYSEVGKVIVGQRDMIEGKQADDHQRGMADHGEGHQAAQINL